MKVTPMEDLVPLSVAEREIMEFIWEMGEVSATEVRKHFDSRKPLARTTVQTMMTRMEEKGWLKHRSIGRTFVYSATLRKQASLVAKVRELIDSTFHGAADELMLSILEYRGLSKKERMRIREMLDEAGNRQKKRRPKK
jgi:predicted transcriptional regulator